MISRKKLAMYFPEQFKGLGSKQQQKITRRKEKNKNEKTWQAQSRNYGYTS